MTVRLPHRSKQAATAVAGALVVALGADAAEAKPKKTVKPPTISGVVWADADGDGVRDQGEQLVQGAKVTIARKSGSTFKTAKTLTTTQKGTYSYAVRATGKFRVTVALPTGFGGFSPADQGNDRTDSDLPTTGQSATFTVRPGGKAKRIDVGLRRAVPPPTSTFTEPTAQPTPAPDPAPTPPTPDPPTPTTPTTMTIGDIVWSDTDSDGRRDPGEPGVAGVTVELRSSDNGLLGTTTSSSTGAFSLTATIGSSYRLRVVLPTGNVFTYKDNAGDDAIDSDVNRTGADTGFTDLFTASTALPKVGVGLTSPGLTQVGNFVFQDVDGNGSYSADPDREMSGVTVKLWNESHSQVIATTTTSVAGAYAIQAPRGVKYRLEFVVPTFYLAAPQNVGDSSLDSDIYVSGEFAHHTPLFEVSTTPLGTLDAGFILPINLGDRVWDDLDADGIQDTGEPGLSGVTVQLWNPARNKLYSSTVSSATGSYMLKAPGAQSYRIRAVLPGRAADFSPKQQGADDAKDSDINPAGTYLGFTDTFTLATNLISTTLYDVGIILS